MKPQNLGFRERDVIQLFDFGLCRELPKPKGQSHRDEDLEDEETFHMSGVGTQRYMAPEILNTRRYNLKADVFSWSMVVLEMMSWKKPFSEYTPEEHQFNVGQSGERPRLITTLDDDAAGAGAADDVDDPVHDEGNDSKDNRKPKMKRKRAGAVLVNDWPLGLKELVQEAWAQDVGDRLTMQSALKRLEPIVANHSSDRAEKAALGAARVTCISSITSQTRRLRLEEEEESEVVLEFPSHFSPPPMNSLSAHFRRQHYQQQQRYEAQKQHQRIRSGEDSDHWSADRQSQSEASSSLLELTMTSASTTLHDSTSITTT